MHYTHSFSSYLFYHLSLNSKSRNLSLPFAHLTLIPSNHHTLLSIHVSFLTNNPSNSPFSTQFIHFTNAANSPLLPELHGIVCETSHTPPPILSQFPTHHTLAFRSPITVQSRMKIPLERTNSTFPLCFYPYSQLLGDFHYILSLFRTNLPASIQTSTRTGHDFHSVIDALPSLLNSHSQLYLDLHRKILNVSKPINERSSKHGFLPYTHRTLHKIAVSHCSCSFH